MATVPSFHRTSRPGLPIEEGDIEVGEAEHDDGEDEGDDAAGASHARTRTLFG
jgi:hypothetical protein